MVKLGDFQDRRGNLLHATVRYNWYIIVLFAIIGAIVGAGLGHVKAAKYTSSTTLLINPIVGNPYTPDSNSDTLEMLQTEAVAVTSQEIVDGVVDDLSLDTTPDLVRRKTVVAVPSNTQALKITFTSGDRQTAADVVKALADRYLASRQAQAEENIESRATKLEDQIKVAQANLANAIEDDNAALESGYKADLLDQQSNLSTVRTSPTDPGRVLTPGFVPGASQGKHYATFVIGGLVAFGLLGIVVALWRERRRDLVRSPRDLADYVFDAPVTAIHGVELDDEALRHLRMRLAPQIRDHGIVALVGLAPGHAMATGVLLGNSLAGGGTSVVLIDGTGTEERHRDILDLDGKPGLAQALVSKDPKPPVAQRISANFSYLPAGADFADASEHLVDDRANMVVHGVAERYDLTLVACMPLDNVEGEALARLAEGVLLLVEVNRTSHYDLGVALTAIEAQGRRLIGVFVLPASK